MLALILSRNTDINDASRTIKPKELENCVPFVELQVAFDGIAVMVNPSNLSVH